MRSMVEGGRAAAISTVSRQGRRQLKYAGLRAAAPPHPLRRSPSPAARVRNARTGSADYIMKYDIYQLVH